MINYYDFFFSSEEMLATKYALWWSPSGKYLAYVQFNDSDIPVIEYSYFGEDQYPRKIIIPYPKVCFLILLTYFLVRNEL